MLGRPAVGAAGLAKAGEARAASGKVGFAIGVAPGAIGWVDAGVAAAGTAPERRSVPAGITPPPAGAGECASKAVGDAALADCVATGEATAPRGLSLNLPGSSAAGAAAGTAETGTGTGSGGSGRGTIVGRGAGAAGAGNGATPALAAGAAGDAGAVGDAAFCDAPSLVVTDCPGLNRGLSRKGGDWGSLLMTLSSGGCSE